MKARRTFAAKSSAVPTSAVPFDAYDSRRKAEFLLNNAVDDADYAQLGLSPRKILHRRPA
ncbi:MAG TPA: hypothetical protein VFN53_06580 [Acidobacteriaceae bacterium]|nr:hypothetical protein [Acidobacteriaceae bacterium]